MRRSRWWIVVAIILAVLVLFGLGFGWFFGVLFNRPTPPDTPRITPPPQSIRTLSTGLDTPWGLAFLPDGTALISERDSGRILSRSADGKITEVARIPGVRASGESGLLGIAVSPTYATDRWVYAYYTTDGDNRIARLHLGGAPEPILIGLPRANLHDGGRIAFGPDGMLYAGVGDALQRDRAQDLNYLGGKILRITPEGRPAPGNPFGDSPVWTYGHRNVQGLAWDSSGRMYASEFGQNRYDELNIIEPGHNYGWPNVEGVGNNPAYTDPLVTWVPSAASPSGIAIVGDRVFVACLRGERLYRTSLDGKQVQALLVGEYGRLRTVAAAPDGVLWITTSNRDGRGDPKPADDRIIRLDPAALPR